MGNASAAAALPVRGPSSGLRWTGAGLLAAAGTWVVLVLLASSEASAPSDGHATTGLFGVDMVTVTSTESSDRVSAGLSTEPGAVVLLTLPVAGTAVALTRQRRLRELARRD